MENLQVSTGGVLTGAGPGSWGFMQKQQGHSYQAIPGFGHGSHCNKPDRNGGGIGSFCVGEHGYPRGQKGFWELN